MPDPGADKTDDPAGWTVLWYGLGVMILLFGGFYGVFRYYLHHRVDAKIQQLAAKGYATTVDDLRRMYPRPKTGQNAADLYMKAAEKVVEAPDEQSDIMPIVGAGEEPDADKPLPAEVEKAIRQHLDKNEDALGITVRAADVKAARYPIDLSKGPAMLLPHLSEIRELEQLLALRAVYSARQKKGEKVFESLRAGIALAESLKKEPLLISQLARIGCHRSVIDALEKGVLYGSLEGQHLAVLQREMEATEDERMIARGLQGELAAFGIHVFRRSIQDLMKYLSRYQSEPLLWLYAYSGAQQLDFLAYMDRMEMYLDSSRKPLEKQLKALPRISPGKSLPFYCVITPMMLFAFRGMTEEQLKWIALLRAARMGIAVERFRQDNGHMPDTLSKLVPRYADAVLTDPFTSKPLKYRSDANRCVVYSLGTNKKDNGGMDEDQKDIVFTVKKANDTSPGDAEETANSPRNERRRRR